MCAPAKLPKQLLILLWSSSKKTFRKYNYAWSFMNISIACQYYFSVAIVLQDKTYNKTDWYRKQKVYGTEPEKLMHEMNCDLLTIFDRIKINHHPVLYAPSWSSFIEDVDVIIGFAEKQRCWCSIDHLLCRLNLYKLQWGLWCWSLVLVGLLDHL